MEVEITAWIPIISFDLYSIPMLVMNCITDYVDLLRPCRSGAFQ